ncbi:MAG: metallophosphoesterase family protein [Bacillota bacterium]|nr:metallophosphoesterase family protein [Bacillota bacterium]
MRYYIADLHFWHRALNEHMDCRGFSSVEEMNAYMIEQWNKKVRKNDEVVILGDFSWGTAQQTQEVLDQLQGKLYLIVGNHDRFLDDKKFDASRFVWIKQYAELNENRRKVILSHYPIACYNGQYRKDEDGNPKTYMLHGHIHKTQDQQLMDTFEEYVKNQTHEAIGGGIEHIPCHFINCFCMYSDYQPMTFDEWLELDKKRKNKEI